MAHALEREILARRRVTAQAIEEFVEALVDRSKRTPNRSTSPSRTANMSSLSVGIIEFENEDWKLGVRLQGKRGRLNCLSGHSFRSR